MFDHGRGGIHYLHLDMLINLDMLIRRPKIWQSLLGCNARIHRKEWDTGGEEGEGDTEPMGSRFPTRLASPTRPLSPKDSATCIRTFDQSRTWTSQSCWSSFTQENEKLAARKLGIMQDQSMMLVAATCIVSKATYNRPARSIQRMSATIRGKSTKSNSLSLPTRLSGTAALLDRAYIPPTRMHRLEPRLSRFLANT